jgi:hypothetical protein
LLQAPQSICGHVAFIELDAQMSYKQALAWWATGDERYANNALRIIDAWASTNQVSNKLKRNKSQ